jgi:putative SOS response-associated peptidase YedK
MCGRYVLKTPGGVLVSAFALDAAADFPPRYNIPPGTDIPVVRHSPEGRRVLHLLHWGLVPHWARDPAMGARLNNARAETLAEKPAFRDAFRRRRCLIPADGFYEWQTDGRHKQPYYFSLRSGQPLAMAGLWEAWRAPDGGVLRSCAVITTGPNAVMAPIHDRMPVIVAPEHWQAWLTGPVEAVLGLLAPLPAEDLQAWPVSRRVSRASADDPSLIEPLPQPAG